MGDASRVGAESKRIHPENCWSPIINLSYLQPAKFAWFSNWGQLDLPPQILGLAASSRPRGEPAEKLSSRG